MANKRKKKKGRGIKLGRLIIIALAVYVLMVIMNQRKLMNDMKNKKADLDADIQKLENEIGELNKEIEDSDSLEFVEKVAREDMGMVKPREIIYIDKKKFKNSIFNLFKR